MKLRTFVAMIAALWGAEQAMAERSLTIGTVNNYDILTMQKMSKHFEAAYPDIKLKWVILDENVLRSRLTTDIATNGRQFDVMTIGLFEAPMWEQRKWLSALDDAPASYDMQDILAWVKDGLSYAGTSYALPFYAESQMTCYYRDLFDKAGIIMPAEPTWAQIGEFAARINDPDHSVYGMCLRGKPGWGENVKQIDPVANSYGARWFDMHWKPQLDTPAWKEALTTYTNLLQIYGPPGASFNGYNENLALVTSGKCGMWVDATVADYVSYAPAPYGKVDIGNHCLWAWALAVPVSLKSQTAAKQFIYWATSPEYIRLVAEMNGVAAVPPGTRKSTYARTAYLQAAPFAKLTEEAIASADMAHPTVGPVPYHGIYFVDLPEFQAIGGSVGQEFAAVIAGQKTVDEGLKAAQATTQRMMRLAGYPKKASP